MLTRLRAMGSSLVQACRVGRVGLEGALPQTPLLPRRPDAAVVGAARGGSVGAAADGGVARGGLALPAACSLRCRRHLGLNRFLSHDSSLLTSWRHIAYLIMRQLLKVRLVKSITRLG